MLIRLALEPDDGARVEDPPPLLVGRLVDEGREVVVGLDVVGRAVLVELLRVDVELDVDELDVDELDELDDEVEELDELLLEELDDELEVLVEVGAGACVVVGAGACVVVIGAGASSLS